MSPEDENKFREIIREVLPIIIREELAAIFQFEAKPAQITGYNPRKEAALRELAAKMAKG